MVLGMSLQSFTLVHVVISLIGIVSGLLVIYGFLRAKPMPSGTVIFLTSTILTSLTGFLFPFEKVLPSHILGILSLVFLAGALIGRYAMHMAGAGRPLYVICAVIAEYFNVFVLVVQSFMKVPALHALAPTQKEPPFAGTQLAVLALFIALGVFSVRNFRLEPPFRESLRRAA